MRTIEEIKARMMEYENWANKYYKKAKECEMNGDDFGYRTNRELSDENGSYALALKWALGERDY